MGALLHRSFPFSCTAVSYTSQLTVASYISPTASYIFLHSNFNGSDGVVRHVCGYRAASVCQGPLNSQSDLHPIINGAVRAKPFTNAATSTLTGQSSADQVYRCAVWEVVTLQIEISRRWGRAGQDSGSDVGRWRHSGAAADQSDSHRPAGG